jgi:hypothetical protein
LFPTEGFPTKTRRAQWQWPAMIFLFLPPALSSKDGDPTDFIFCFSNLFWIFESGEPIREIQEIDP